MFNADFDTDISYSGDDLGFSYSKEKTLFKIWAPLAEKVDLNIYRSGDITEELSPESHQMERDERGTWKISINGDLHGMFYTFSIKNLNSKDIEAADPYAKAAGVNGDRSCVVNLESTNPPGWKEDTKPYFPEVMDTVIYELHLRDFSSDIDSGILNKAKYIQFKEDGTTGPGGLKTGLDHLKELGITHLQVLPFFDFGCVDERKKNPDYNWGYDPKNYNVPEGVYATNPYLPETRIFELKEMVLALHRAGIRIVMDVVYNHTHLSSDSLFNKTVPGYYYRMKKDGTFFDGSFCGNETASERFMVRKYIVDSIKYLAKEYHLDGFRFDLMGLHDIETMRMVKSALDEIDQSIILYGEGWNMGHLPEKERAIQANAAKLPGIGFFNDHVRDTLRGFNKKPKKKGFVAGRGKTEKAVKSIAAGSIHYNQFISDYNKSPAQSINYVSCHDDYTLWDKIELSSPNETMEQKIKMHSLALAIVLTSQGIPFLHAGSEFLRTKYGVENSFVSPDRINTIEWLKKEKYYSVFEYVKGLISLRKSHPAFKIGNTKTIKKHMEFLPSPSRTVSFLLKEYANGDSWENIVVGYNARKTKVNIKIPEFQWNIVVQGGKAGTEILNKFQGSKIAVDPLSTLVAFSVKK